MVKELEHINWFDTPNWASNIILGNDDMRYRFKAHWNNRNNSWMISISYDEEVIIQGAQLLLNVDLLQHSHHSLKPNCMLIANTENDNIERINFENMVNGNVKLYHILKEDLDA